MNLSLFEPAAIVVMLVILGNFSKRLGAVSRRPPLYHLHYVAAVLVGVGTLFRVIGVDGTGRVDHLNTLIYDVLLVIGLLIAVIVTWRYWGWLLFERETG